MNTKFVTLGCKVNFYESNAVMQTFLNNGFTIKDDINPDIIVINTCSVTAVADQKSRQHIRKYSREYPNAIIAVMGCYSQKNGAYIINNCGAHIVVGTSNRNKIFQYVLNYIEDKKTIVDIGDNIDNFQYELFPFFARPNTTRAYIKIQDGCDNYCSYCTIPYTRGHSRSRDKDDIIKEIKMLIKDGFKEFVITGIHTAHYGRDLIDITFSSFIEEVLQLEGLYRLRISSIEESEIDDHLISLFGKYKNLAHHLHIPLQSGDKTILKAMNRHYNPDDFIKKINLIRERCNDIAITTDVIVGFPGETDEMFKNTVDFIKKISFSSIHVFPYSDREGTVASRLPNKLSKEIKSKRVNELLILNKELTEKFKNKFIGRELEVLLEERNKLTGQLEGFTSNYLRYKCDLNDEYINKVVTIKYK